MVCPQFGGAGHQVVVPAGQLVSVVTGHWVGSSVQSVGLFGQPVIFSGQRVNSCGQLVSTPGQKVGLSGHWVTAMPNGQIVGNTGHRVCAPGQKVCFAGHWVGTSGHMVAPVMVGHRVVFRPAHSVSSGAQNVCVSSDDGHCVARCGQMVSATGQTVLEVVGQAVLLAGHWVDTSGSGQVVMVPLDAGQ
jgi:hypothetical protein